MDWLDPVIDLLNRVLQPIVDFANTYIIEIGPSFGGERVPLMVILYLLAAFYVIAVGLLFDFIWKLAIFIMRGAGRKKA